MSDKFNTFQQANSPLPSQYKLWPLYGAGYENLGRDGQMIDVILPEPGPEELLVRHDAVGICFSDVKVVKAGQNHPRIRKNMKVDPVVLGHEVALTIVKVGEKLRKQYQPGDRFLMQADIYYKGQYETYGYQMQGGFSQYNIVDRRVLNGDGGNYLLPIRKPIGYAEAALNEPWACVDASYAINYRVGWKEGGTVLLVGNGNNTKLGGAARWRPNKVVLQVTNESFAKEVIRWARQNNIEILQGDDGATKFDDIVILDNDPDLMERYFLRLANYGIFCVVTQSPIARPVKVDIGRMHYDYLFIVGTDSNEIAGAYGRTRTQLKNGGLLWTLGAAGPMGQMHVQRALEGENKPRKVVASNLNWARMEVLEKKLQATAQKEGVELLCLSRDQLASDQALVQRLQAESDGRGFDDIVVIAASVPAIENCVALAGDDCTVNVFAGLPRGTQAALDLNPFVTRGVRFTGMSGSSIDDLRHILELTEAGKLSPNLSVAAIAGLEGLPDGLHAVQDGRFAGKIVIYPQITHGLPLTPISELQEKLPSVHAKLAEDGAWTNEAEAELLSVML